ncbi:MAG TPA: transketolase [Candidatus Saccharimonadales bacterium]|nr:transketolase [Candidatus Saccharimonadales bacterium]
MADLIAAPPTDADLNELAERAAEARRRIVTAVGRAKAGHLGGPLSAVDVLTVLYGGVLRVRPDVPDWPDRDRFVLSKGHASIGLYAVLALAGYLPVEELDTFDDLGTRLQGHPDMTRLPGLDMSTGSLGLGISAAVGMALGAKRQGRDLRVFTMVGDGECQEGQVWEAAIFAAREGLDRLVAIVDVNGLQQFGWVDPESGSRQRPWATEGLAAIWAAFGWRPIGVDGHDLRDIAAGLRSAVIDAVPGQPTVVLAETTKGRGVSFMEGRFEWHARVPTEAEASQALAELGG